MKPGYEGDWWWLAFWTLVSLWLWGWTVARLAGTLSARGKDPALVMPLIAGLLFVWLASGLAGFLAGRAARDLG